jgi:hypothetical protein
MKNTSIGLIVGIIITIWIFYFIRINPSKLFSNNNNTPIPTPEPKISIYPSITLAPTPSPLASQDDDALLVKEAIAKKYHKNVNDIDLTISDYDGSHVWGSFKFKLAMEGGWILAAKNKELQWVVVQDGNGTITCELIAPYDFPVTMVSECVNKQGNLIKL